MDGGFAARCLLRASRSAVLATQYGGQPFASLVTPAVTPGGDVLLLLSALSAHTRHLAAEPRCALIVCGTATGANPQTAPRLTVTGGASREPDPECRDFWLARHPYAAFYAGFADFSLWRVTPEAGHFIGGFARAEQLDKAALRPAASAVSRLVQAAPDLIADAEALVGHLGSLARLAGAPRIVGVDVDGVDVADADTVVHIPFAGTVADAAGARAALYRLAEAAPFSRSTMPGGLPGALGALG